MRLDPFQPEKPEDVEWLLGMQGELHDLFIEWVRARRDGLAETEDLFTGEVWTGRRALELGLVDALGTTREVLAARFPGAEPVSVEPRKPLLARLGIAGLAAPGLGASPAATSVPWPRCPPRRRRAWRPRWSSGPSTARCGAGSACRAPVTLGRRDESVKRSPRGLAAT